ncbi:hypothetical protein [Nostoc sp. FACHB-892]|nr:hypothetical protein [Nostoc sp. FACHB-892]
MDISARERSLAYLYLWRSLRYYCKLTNRLAKGYQIQSIRG